MADSANSPAPRVSRYRSQRKAQQQTPVAEPPLPSPQDQPQQDAAHNDSIGRSKSRYHRRPPTVSAQPAQDHIDVAPRPLNGQNASQSQQRQLYQNGRPSQRNAPPPTAYDDRNVSPPAHLGAPDMRRAHDDAPYLDNKHAPPGRLNERHDSHRLEKSTSVPTHPPATSQPSTADLFPPPQQASAVKPAARPVQTDGPPTSEQIRATKSMSALPKYSDTEDDEAGCFGLFKRKRGENVPQAEKLMMARSTSNGEAHPGAVGVGGVAGVDAPISAVNAGDRRVVVECGKSKTIFPVTPTTTPVDIIKSAATCMNERIDVKSAVLLEHFGTVGVQRPLRRYEHIRDVMNSWDTDRQNSLLLVDPGTGSSEAELNIAGVPKEKPGDESWILSLSQKVGKWDRRFITLREDGQIVAQKDPNKSKDQVTICHLSDFDIYTPTQDKLKRKIKPPKKICFAIKSQQKTSIFESTQNFVHFFCTSDRPTANSFYNAVQGWRSWYLVNVMGEGKKAEVPSGEQHLARRASESKRHQTGQSLDSTYQLGSFKPLLGADNFEKRPGTSRSQDDAPRFSGGFTKSANQFDTTISPERRTSTARRKQYPPAAMSNKAQLADDEPLVNLGRRPSVDRRRPSLDQTKASPEEFLETGLLGRNYSQRQRDYNQRENGKSNASPHSPTNGVAEEYTARRSLDGGPKRTHSTRAQQAHRPSNGSSDLQRTSSRARDKPKPLVDLSPQYREPPQHTKKGRAYVPDEPGTLIDSATSPDDPIGAPASTDWRGQNNAQTHARTNSLSRNKSTARSQRRPNTSSQPQSSSKLFTGFEGLLASSQQGWGGGDKGRGVIDGSRAKGPMLDMSEQSKFMHGSLLEGVEMKEGREGVVVDRSREE